MRITVLGGGNIGTALAVLSSERGHEVTLVSSKPQAFGSDPVILDHDGKETHRGRNLRALSDSDEMQKGERLFFFTYPAFLAREKARCLMKRIPGGSVLCFVPGSGGMEQEFREMLGRGVVLCGTERVPAIARIKTYGKAVVCGALREELHVAALPGEKKDRCCRLVEEAVGIPVKGVDGYLNITLTPSNPILHTARLRTIFSVYREGMTYPALPLFYEDWDLPSAERLLRMDEEVQEIVRALPELSLQGVKSLKTHYESESAAAMQKKLSSIPAFAGIQTPGKKTEGGLIPDLSSRYFVSDFPFGLKILLDTAAIAGVRAPWMAETYEWYRKLVPVGREFSFSAFGIRDRNDLVNFYGKNAALY